MTNIDILMDNKYDLLTRTAQLGAEIISELQAGAEKTNIIGEVRGKGLFVGIEMVKNKESREPLPPEKMGAILGELLNSGIIVVPCGRYHNVIRFMPSLVITREYLEKAVGILLDICRKY